VFTEEQISYLRSFGIYIEENSPYLMGMDWFLSLFFDLNEVLWCVIIICIYTYEIKIIKAEQTNPLSEKALLNPIFCSYFVVPLGISFTVIFFDSIFVQTFF